MGNALLQLKGPWESHKGFNPPVRLIFPNTLNVKGSHIETLVDQLRSIHTRWMADKALDGALVSVHYSKIIPKSSRIGTLLARSGHTDPNSIRGVKFETVTKEDGSQTLKHVFTYFIPLAALEKSIRELDAAAKIVAKDFAKSFSYDDSQQLTQDKLAKSEAISTSKFLGIIHDIQFIERFDIDTFTGEFEKNKDTLISIYRTDEDCRKLLSRFGINILDNRMLNDTTFYLNWQEIQLLRKNAPYLIAMGLTDFRELTDKDAGFKSETQETGFQYPPPTNEPTIGVIDTLFNPSVPFSSWVKYKNMLDGIEKDVEIDEDDTRHGTAVTSIIVDGPRLNPQLEDNCGRFRARHFGVATRFGFSSFKILRMIREIVEQNPDIKVWNLSLGSAMEISNNFISPEAAELDRIQNEYDIIFVVAGTNIPTNHPNSPMKIGAPADSLNSIVVNSVAFDRKPASYTRTGPVLSFFHKPDLCYYGGDGKTADTRITVDDGSYFTMSVTGTSFAAPWISRKLAYLIHVMGLTREVAKALLIDSAAQWNARTDVNRIGYGIVPIPIHEIIESPKDEIRFVMSGVADEFETYTYQLPVPIHEGAHPYFARATLAYFPFCNRNNGVDYTGTEMDIHFGRVTEKDGKPCVKSIDNNKQGDDDACGLFEEKARGMYRKWDNIKHIVDKINERPRPRKVYGPGLWGLSIKTKDRMSGGSREKLAFGIVITLKEMKGVNRIEDFIQHCLARGWIVNRLDLQTHIDIYAKAEEEIGFE